MAPGAVSGPLKGIGGLIGSNAGPILRSATVAGQTVSGGASAAPSAAWSVTIRIDHREPLGEHGQRQWHWASESIGGLVGVNAAGTGITSSYATGAVTAGNANKVGGLVRRQHRWRDQW